MFKGMEDSILEKTYCCGICASSHMYTHNGEKPYKCGLCTDQYLEVPSTFTFTWLENGKILKSFCTGKDSVYEGCEKIMLLEKDCMEKTFFIICVNILEIDFKVIRSV